MRRTARRQSVAGFVIWGTALTVVVALMAWQFGWWPEGSSAPTAAVPGPQPELGTAAPMPYEPVDVDPVVFTGQSEPEVLEEPFDRPENSSAAYRRLQPETAAPAANPFAEVEHAASPTQPAVLPPPDPAARQIAPVGEPAHLQSPPPSPIQPVANVELATEAAQPDQIPTTADPELDQIDGQIAAGEYLQAHKTLSKIYWAQPERRPEIQERIDRTAEIIYLSPQPHLMPAYVVQPGDLLSKIASKYSVTWEYLARLNRVDPQRIQAGQRLKVIKGPFAAIIDLSRFELIVHAHGYYVRRYPVGIGKDHSTPTGKFTVRNKEFNPTYYGTDEQTGRRFVVERDDPQNPLGERWIDLGDSYGIHGTIDPGSVGKAESRGCIRLRNEDVEIVYDLLSVGSEVVIRR